MDLRNILLYSCTIHVCFVYRLIHVSHHEHIYTLYWSTPLTVIVCTARYRLVTKEYPSRLDRATEPSRRIAMMASRLIRVRRLKSESIFWILSFVSLLMIIIIITTYIYIYDTIEIDDTCPQQWRGNETYIHTYIHTYIDAYIHTHIHITYIHTYNIHTYIHTNIHTYIHAYKQTYISAYIHAYIHTNRHTYISAYIHAYKHTYIHTKTHTNIH